MDTTDRARTGVTGLDDLLGGGLPRGRIYLVDGDPGAGKTTLAMQFLLEGVQEGERSLYVTLSETRDEIQAVARSHGWSLEKVVLFELSAVEQALGLETQNSIFDPAEVELQETTQIILKEVERVQPARVVLDSLSELRLLAQSPLRYRRQVLSLKQYFAGRGITVLLLDDRTSTAGDLQLQSLAHGVIELEQTTPMYGDDRRHLRIAKLRGVKFRTGRHEFVIRTGGVVVAPRLVAADYTAPFVPETLSSGNAELDTLLGGGIDRGTSTLLAGPAGVGKSTVAMHYALAAVKRGQRAIVFAFDEPRTIAIARARSTGLPIQEFLANDALRIQQIDPAEMGPGEFSDHVRRIVDEEKTSVIVIDTLNGLMNAMPEQQFLQLQLHEMLAYLAQKGVATILIVAQHGIVGSVQAPVDISYISDTVVLLRYFEAHGAILKSIAVIKKRTGRHENTIRELSIGQGGIAVGRPLHEFSGVLTGVPTYTGVRETLLGDEM